MQLMLIMLDLFELFIMFEVIPSNCANYQDFVEQIKNSESAFITSF